ncbi:MAG: carboxypeptidase regulatory-like domain-containing protein [Pyrinomonadaceae bacterium]
MKRFVFAALMSCLFVASAFAQTTSGRLVGAVSGPDGVIPGATITVIDNATQKEITVQSSDEGTFTVPQLEFGTYTVRITAPGFKTFTATEVKIDVNREYTLNPTLEIGQLSEEVTVIAGADVLNASNAQLSTSVSPVQIQELPLDGRSPLSLTTLQAGTASTGGTTSINGQRTAFSNITRDGINVQDNFIRANATDFSPERSSSDDTGEFTIVTQNAGAESGYGAAQIQLVTPRGSDEFNGALYIYNRNSRFAANESVNNSSGDPRPFLNRNQFGGKIGGPFPVPNFGEGGPAVLKGKGFFFFNYEKQFLRESGTFSRTVLTDTARNGIFRFIDSRGVLRSVNIFSLPTSNGTGPTGINPLVQSSILAGLPAGNSTGGDSLNTTGFNFQQPFNDDYDYYTARVDVDINDRHTVNGVITDKREVTLRPDVTANGFAPVGSITQPGINKFLALAYRYSSPSGFSNEVRGGYSKPSANFDQTLTPPGFFLDSAIISEPQDRFLDQGRNQKNYNIQDNASFSLGNHTVRFGFLGQFFNIDPFNAGGNVPTFTLGVSALSPQFTAANFASILPTGTTISATNVGRANSLLSLLGGIVGAGSATFNQSNLSSPFALQPNLEEFEYENYAGYVQDQWRVNPRLSLNFGLRYELYTPLRLLSGLLLEPAIAPGLDPTQAVLDPNGTFQFLGGNGGGNNRFHRTDKNNFAPNVSFAYSPQFKNSLLNSLLPGENRTVIRGGFSISYVQDQTLTGLRNANSGNVGLGSTPSNATVGGDTRLNLRASNDLLGQVTLPTPPTLTTAPTFVANNGPNRSNFGTVFAVDPNLQVTNVMQYNIGIQREIGFNTAVEIRYVGARSGNLQRALDFNQVNIRDNGLLEDFNRARANLLATGSPFTGPNVLTIFGTGTNARIRVTPTSTANAITQATFINTLNAGTPGDLALSILTANADINAANGQFPLVANPNTGVADVFSNSARFNYNSLQAEVRRRFAQGLYFQANYTFAKNLTDAIGTSQALFDPALDITNLDLEYQRADFDQTHAFNFNSIVDLPFGRGKFFFGDVGSGVDRLLGGFRLSTLLRYGVGRPITLIDQRGTLNRFARSGRQTPNSSLSKDEIKNLFGRFVVGDTVFFINPAVLNITQDANGAVQSSTATNGFGQPTFDGQVFFNVEPGQTGNVERAIFNAPNLFNMDVALIKDIRLTEGSRIQLRAEAFNITNRVNYLLPLTIDVNSQTFGILQPDFNFNTARRLQFAFRLEF